MQAISEANSYQASDKQRKVTVLAESGNADCSYQGVRIHLARGNRLYRVQRQNQTTHPCTKQNNTPMHEVIGTSSLPEPLHAMKQKLMYKRDLRETDTHLGQGALFRNRFNGTGGVEWGGGKSARDA